MSVEHDAALDALQRTAVARENGGGLVTSFVKHCEVVISGAQESIYSYGNSSELEAALLDFPAIDDLLADYSKLEPDIIKSASETPSWMSGFLQWQLVLDQAADLFRSRADKQTKSSSAPKEEQAEDDTGDDTDDAGDDDETGGGGMKQANAVLAGYAKSFTYNEEIAALAVGLTERHKTFGAIANGGIWVKDKGLWVWGKFQALAQKMADGLSTLLEGLQKLGDQSRTVEHATRSIGTLLINALKLFILVFLVWRMVSNPDRILRWFVAKLTPPGTLPVDDGEDN